MPFRLSSRRTSRPGATSVELAFILPVFVMILFAVVEFGHAMMIRSLLIATAKDAARQGAIEETSTQEVLDLIAARLGTAIDPSTATIYVKDFSLVDQTDAQPVDVSELPDVELSEIETRDPFIVHIRVPYESVALFPPFWVTGLEITADSVVRHE